MSKKLARMLLLAVVAYLAVACAPAPGPTVAPTSSGPAVGPTVAPTSSGPKLAKEQVVRLADLEWAHLDPGVGGGRGLEPIQNIFEGLVGVDSKTNQLMPLEAEKWELSNDGLVYTFHLRSGMKWSDGHALTANDYEWAWKRNLDPATASTFPNTLYAVKGAEAFNKGQVKDPNSVGVKALDDLTLQVTLERPTPYFLSILTYQPTYPLARWAVEKGGKKWTNSPDTLVSNGPFMLQEWQPGVQATAVRNPYYWGPKPTLDKIVWRFYQDPVGQSLTAYEAGELDQAYVPDAQFERVKNDPVLSKEAALFPRSGTWFLVFVTTQKPTSDVKVRQALSLAIDRDQLSKVILKGVLPAASTITPAGIPGYNPQAALKGSAEDAKRLLAEAGYPGGQGFPELTLTYQVGATSKLAMEAVQAMWKTTLGINVKLDPLELAAFRTWRTARKNQPLNVMLTYWLSDYPDPYDWFNSLWDSKVDFFSSGWQNAEFDKLVQQGLVEQDPAKRKKIYEDAETILVHDAAIVPVLGMDQWYVIKPYVKGILHFPILGRTLLTQAEVLEH